MSFARLPPSSITMYRTCGGAWGVDVMKVLLGASAVAERPSPSVARPTTRAHGERPIDFLKYRVVIFLYSFFWLRLDCLIFRRGFAGRAHAALRLLDGDVECGVDGEAELVECATNMDRMASGSQRRQHQIDPGIDGE